MKKIIVILSIIVTGLSVSWYIGFWNKPVEKINEFIGVEKINELIGKNYDYAHKRYFQKVPDITYKLNVNENLNEFDGGILNSKEILTDSIIHVFTWEYATHKKTIWVGQTEKMESQVIDAISYSNSVQF